MKDDLTTNVHSEQVAPPDAKPLLPAVFSSDEMISFGHFIRDNYYGVGAPKLISHFPSKYPHGTIDEIFVYWCFENGR